jgi:protein-disulfide isomerase
MIDKRRRTGSGMAKGRVWPLEEFVMAGLFRRTLLTLAASLALAGPALAEDRVGARDVVLGKADAPITLVEYGSVTCPHCARFNKDVLPALKAKYVDTGKAKYIFREVPINEQEDTAGFLVARCAGPDKYLAVVDALMRGQPILFEKHEFKGWLMAGAVVGGLDEAQMKACISDTGAIEAFNARAEHTSTVDKIHSTPTVLVNGKQVEVKGPEFAVSDIDAAIQPLLGGKTTTGRHSSRRSHD